MPHAEKLIHGLFESAGIEVNGPHPFDPQIHNPAFYARVLNDGALGLAVDSVYVEPSGRRQSPLAHGRACQLLICGFPDSSAVNLRLWFSIAC